MEQTLGQQIDITSVILASPRNAGNQGRWLIAEVTVGQGAILAI